MTSAPTTISEIDSISFLRARLTGLVSAFNNSALPATLWVGAGFSAKYGNFPTWSTFLRNTFHKTHLPSHPDFPLIDSLLHSSKLSIVAELLQIEDNDVFLSTLTQTFSVTSTTLPSIISHWPITDIITTNYDTLLEQCFPYHNVYLPSSGIDFLLRSHQKIIKIHGTVTRPDTCVASVTNYAKTYDNNLEWYLTHIFSTRTVVFFGSSMNESEPFFRVLQFLKRNRRLNHHHYCILSVSDNKTADTQGRRLESYGILTIPFVPDSAYSFIDEIVLYIASRLLSINNMSNILHNIRSLTYDSHYYDSAAMLTYLSQYNKNTADFNRQICDHILYLCNLLDTLTTGPRVNEDIDSLTKQLSIALTSMNSIFVRTPRSIKKLDSAIKSLRRLDNKYGPLSISKIESLYNM